MKLNGLEYRSCVWNMKGKKKKKTSSCFIFMCKITIFLLVLCYMLFVEKLTIWPSLLKGSFIFAELKEGVSREKRKLLGGVLLLFSLVFPLSLYGIVLMENFKRNHVYIFLIRSWVYADVCTYFIFNVIYSAHNGATVHVRCCRLMHIWNISTQTQSFIERNKCANAR